MDDVTLTSEGSDASTSSITVHLFDPELGCWQLMIGYEWNLSQRRAFFNDSSVRELLSRRQFLHMTSLMRSDSQQALFKEGVLHDLRNTRTFSAF